MVVIRLQSKYCRNRQNDYRKHYRIVVADSRAKRDGKFVEDLGHYSPTHNKFDINRDRLAYWKGVGAQLSKSVTEALNKNA